MPAPDRFATIFGLRGNPVPRVARADFRDGWHDWHVALVEPGGWVGPHLHDGETTLAWFFDRSFTHGHPGQFVAAFGIRELLDAAPRITRDGLPLAGGERRHLIRPATASALVGWLREQVEVFTSSSAAELSS